MSEYKPIEMRAKRRDYKEADQVIHKAEVLGPEAAFAMELCGRWALVAAMPDGEDTAGRQKLRLPTPEELTARTMEIAKSLFGAMRAEGWTLPVPLPLVDVKAQEAEEKTA